MDTPTSPIYMDHAATTPLAEAVLEEMQPWFRERCANPSTRYAAGVRARDAIDTARARIAQLTGAAPQGVSFTSGGTEANNWAVLGLARDAQRQGRHLLIGPTEHSSVRAACEVLRGEGFEIEVLASDPALPGSVDLADLERKLRPDTVLVALMMVSNELGRIQPIRRVAQRLRRNSSRAALHVDAVQALGKCALDLTELGASSLALSAHKVHGPQGVGALVRAEGVRPRPLLYGGGQEDGLRAGTENVAGIVGFGAAARFAERERASAWKHWSELRARFEAGLAALPHLCLLLGSEGCVPNIWSLLVPGAPAETWQHQLEQQGLYVGLGSACQSNARSQSPTWRAIGLDAAESKQVLRLSLARTSTHAEVQRALEALAATTARLEALSA